MISFRLLMLLCLTALVQRDADTQHTSESTVGVSDICALPVDRGLCYALMRRYYFDMNVGHCQSFMYGGCMGNANNFLTEASCINSCGTGDISIVPSSPPLCDDSLCPWKLWAHYREKGCEPVYEDMACCPSYFNCSIPISYNKSTDCVYEGKVYLRGSTVPTPNNCLRCFCDLGFVDRGVYYPPVVNCEPRECSEMIYNRPEDGCHAIYTKQYCCAVEIVCNENTTEQICEYNGEKYYDGENIIAADDAPCQMCICSPEYQGPFGPGCHTFQCEVDPEQTYYSKGCVPVYRETKCCPSQYHCPPDADSTSQNLEEPLVEVLDTTCKFGNGVYQLGQVVPTNVTLSMTCTCSTPPEITCIAP